MREKLHNWEALAADIKDWGKELGFSQMGITDTDLSAAEERYRQWILKGFHGAMDYMAKHGDKRTRPAELIPGTLRVISVRMEYLPPAETVRPHCREYFQYRIPLSRVH